MASRARMLRTGWIPSRSFYLKVDEAIQARLCTTCSGNVSDAVVRLAWLPGWSRTRDRKREPWPACCCMTRRMRQRTSPPLATAEACMQAVTTSCLPSLLASDSPAKPRHSPVALKLRTLRAICRWKCKGLALAKFMAFSAICGSWLMQDDPRASKPHWRSRDPSSELVLIPFLARPIHYETHHSQSGPPPAMTSTNNPSVPSPYGFDAARRGSLTNAGSPPNPYGTAPLPRCQPASSSVSKLTQLQAHPLTNLLRRHLLRDRRCLLHHRLPSSTPMHRRCSVHNML
jgi:hypothetical protein